ncbi:MAG: sugar phosphate isomerase/epimerase [Actinobacteria bacterium]|nr:sugar phosphate isomerase/epimerase [Actinomycetota bacterium]
MRPALHSLMFAAYAVARFAPIARALGYEGVALMSRPPHIDLRQPEATAQACAAALREVGLTPVALASHLGRLDSYLGAAAASELEAVHHAVAAAATAGMPLIRLWGGGPGLDRGVAAEHAAALAWYRRAADVAAAAGLRAMIEVHATGLANSTRDACALVDAIGHPSLGLALDTGNLHVAAGPIAGADVVAMGPRIFDVHVKDLRQLASAAGHTLHVGGQYYLHTLLGEGEVRNPSVLAALALAGYEGWVTSECECQWPDWEASVAAARHEARELRRLIAAAQAAT